MLVDDNGALGQRSGVGIADVLDRAGHHGCDSTID
jgi:hypothetical protein